MSVSRAANARHWQRHVERWRRGTLSKSHYCHEHGLAQSSFHRWVRRLADTPPPAASAPSIPSTPMKPVTPMTLIPVRLRDEATPTSAQVVVRVGRLSITLPASLEAPQVRTWLDALAQVP